MGSPTTPTFIDPLVWHKLFDPISMTQPAGELLKDNHVYDDIHRARFEDDNLPQGIWQRVQKQADWERVEKLCLDALTRQTKDLQIAAWLTEALLIQHKIPGLLAGLTIVHTLCERFWLDLYPRLEANDADYRLAPFLWMNEKMVDRLNLVSITAVGNTQPSALTYGDWVMVNQAASAKKTAGPAVVMTQGLTIKSFKDIQKNTPTSFYRTLREQLAQVGEVTTALEKFITERIPGERGTVNSLRQQSQKIREFCQFTLKERGDNETVASASTTSPILRQDHKVMSTDSTSPSVTPSPPLSQISDVNSATSITTETSLDTKPTREQAYAMLAEAAAILERLEPHSPSSYLVRRAIAWGKMSLVELMQEMIRDPNNLGQIMQLLGVELPVKK